MNLQCVIDEYLHVLCARPVSTDTRARRAQECRSAARRGTVDLVGFQVDGIGPERSGDLQFVRPRGPLAAVAVSVWRAAARGPLRHGGHWGDNVLDATLRRHGLPVLGVLHRSGSLWSLGERRRFLYVREQEETS